MEWIATISCLATVIACFFAVRTYYLMASRDEQEPTLSSHTENLEPSHLQGPAGPSGNIVQAEFSHQMKVFAAIALQYFSAFIALIFIVMVSSIGDDAEYKLEASISSVAFGVVVFGLWTYISIWLKHNRSRYQHDEHEL